MTNAALTSKVYPYLLERSFRGVQIPVDNQHATLLVTATELANSKGRAYAGYAAGQVMYHLPVVSYGHITAGADYPTWGHAGNGDKIGGIVVAFGAPGASNGIDNPTADITSVYPETTSKVMTVLLANSGLDIAVFKYTGTAPDPALRKSTDKTAGRAGRVVGSATQESVKIASSDAEYDAGLEVIAVDTVLNLVAVYL